MKQYDSYKDSGVQWIGEIPSHWKVGRLKFTGNFGNGLTYSPNDVTDSNGILVLRSSNIKSNHLAFDDCVYVKSANKELMVQKGDIIICSRNGSANLVGKCAYVESSIHATFGAFMMRYKPSISNRFAFYLFQSATDYYKGLFSTTTINQLTSGIINQMVVPYLPLAEQQAIAIHLDKKCAEIDKAIATQQKRIELLQELRQNIITHAVTRGINPDVPLKDSGVEWIGMVPENWEVRKLKYIAFLQSGNTISSEDFTDEGFPVYGGNGFRGYTNKYNVDGEYILIGRQGALCGNINYAKGQFYASEHAIVVYPHKKENIMWLGELLRVSDLNQYSLTAAQPGIAVSEIKNIYYPYPPEEERSKIGKKIAETVQKIEPAITKANRQISLLQELKQSIITEVVTGKRKVC